MNQTNISILISGAKLIIIMILVMTPTIIFLMDRTTQGGKKLFLVVMDIVSKLSLLLFWSSIISGSLL